jgi:23S rRNA pseudouridine1911/1915/1917 synthase
MKEQRAVPPALANLALDALVKELFGTSWGKARSWIETGKIAVDGATVTETRAPVKPGASIALDMNAPRPRADASLTGEAGATFTPVFGRERIVFVDSQLVVADKPPGMSSVPYERDETGTLVQEVGRLLKQPRLEVVHRIDRETSGLIVFARTREAARALSNQFRFHTVHRRYLALVHGRARDATCRSILIEDRGDGLRGTVPAGWRVARGEGQEAITHVRALEALPGATLVECRLETGRTHPIRIHLSEAGHPLVGERLYVRDYRGERLSAPRVMLHAAELGFEHPATGARMSWSAQLPEDFEAALSGIRRATRSERS